MDKNTNSSYQSSLFSDLSTSRPPTSSSPSGPSGSNPQGVTRTQSGSGKRSGSSIYGRAYPGQAFTEYWTAFEAEQLLRKSIRADPTLSNSVSHSRAGFPAIPNAPVIPAMTTVIPAPSANIAAKPAAETEAQKTTPASNNKYVYQEDPVYAFTSNLLNSLRAAPLPKDKLATSWMVVKQPNEKAEVENPEGTDTGDIEKLVSLLNSNIHSSSTHEEKTNLESFSKLFNDSPIIDLTSLRLLISEQAQCIPPEWRALSWQLLLGLLPPEKSEWPSTLNRRRSEYFALVEKHFVPPKDPGTPRHSLQYLVRMDVERTHPHGFENLFLNPLVVEAFKRLLFTWAQVHPDVDYFQGLNEITVPIFLVFLTSCFGACGDHHDEYAKNVRVKERMAKDLPRVEADTFWAVDAVMNRLRAVHPFTVGGIHAESMLAKLETIVTQSNPELIRHLTSKLQIELIHFTFRWALCLLARELSPRNTILLWDMYFADTDPRGFPMFHVYVCAAFLKLLAEPVLEIDDMEKGMFLLQKPPTHYWDENNIRELVWSAREIRANFPLDH